MSKRTKFLDGKLTGSFPGLTAVLLSFSMAFAACNSPVSTGSDSGSGDPVEIVPVDPSDPKTPVTILDPAEDSALVLNKGGKRIFVWDGITIDELIKLQAKWKLTLSDPAKQAAFGWPADECAVVTGAIDAFTAACDAHDATHTHESLFAFLETMDASTKAMFDFANAHIIGNNLMSVKDKLALGILF